MNSNNEIKESYSWFAFGFVLGLLLLINLMIAFEPTVTWFQIFKDFQTLISAFIAILAAGITYKSSRAQIQSSEKLADDRLLRRASAVRSALPFQASVLTDYVHDCLDELKKVYKNGIYKNGIKVRQFDANLVNRVNLPYRFQEYFIELIETHNSNSQNHLAQFLSELQKCHATFLSLGKERPSIEGDIISPISKNDLINLIFKYLKIYCLVEDLFLFGRKYSEEYNIDNTFTSQKLNNAARILRVDNDDVIRYISSWCNEYSTSTN
jgi:hypothetical protein